MALRENSLHIRLTEKERKRAERLAERLGCSSGAVFRQGMNDLYERIFGMEREKREPREK